jgi:hypothetical protein
LLREAARAQAEVEVLLERVERRARAEGWPAHGEVVRCAREVRRLREALEVALSRRLGAGEGMEPLGRSLERLEARLLGARRGLPGEPWQAALEALPGHLPELEHTARFGAALEAAFLRPTPPGQRLPFSLEELEALAAAWEEGERALAAVWQRLGALDATGTLERLLRRRARRVPGKAPRNGLEVLWHAESWRALAGTRLDALLAARVEPVRCREGERLLVARWLWRREGDVEARLSASERLPEGRAGLFELAHELVALGALPPPAHAVWERLLERAARADGAREDADWFRVREVLRLRLHARAAPERRELPPLYRTLGRPLASAPRQEEPRTLEGLMAALRAARGPARRSSAVGRRTAG